MVFELNLWYIGTKTQGMYARNINTRGSVQTLKNRTKYSVSSQAGKITLMPQPHLEKVQRYFER